MAQTVGDFFWDRLYQRGVRSVFGYPGGGINGLLGALNRFGEDAIRLVQVRHEDMAAFMASACAKFTGELGVCMATSGPGASHLITGMYDARIDHMPLLAIVGQQARPAMGGHYHVPYHRFAELIGLRGIYVDRAEQMPGAWKEALSAGRPVVLEVKTDPNVPPLPPHITLAPAKAFTSTILKGDPEEGSMLLDTAKEMLSGVLPGLRS